MYRFMRRTVIFGREVPARKTAVKVSRYSSLRKVIAIRHVKFFCRIRCWIQQYTFGQLFSFEVTPSVLISNVKY